MKRNRIVTLLISLLLIMCTLLTSCGTVLNSLPESDRVRILFNNADKHIFEDRYHYSYEISVTIREAGEEYTANVAFEEIYDGRDPENEKLYYKESINEIAGSLQEICYTDGQMYMSTEGDRICVPIESFDLAVQYVPYYDIYYETTTMVTVRCPKPEKGKPYTVTQIYNYSDKTKLEVYNYLWWAVPSYMYEQMKVKSFVDSYTFDKKNRISQYEADIELTSTLADNADSASIKLIRYSYYDDYEVHAPEDAEEYTVAECYTELDDLFYAYNQFVQTPYGAFDVTYEYFFDGPMREEYHESSMVTCQPDDENGVFFRQIDQGSGEESSYHVITEYEDGKLVSTSDGQRNEIPASPADVYYLVYGSRDFLQLRKTSIKEAEIVKKDDGSTRYTMVPLDAYVIRLTQAELEYFGYTAEQESISVLDSHLSVVINSDEEVERIYLYMRVGFVHEGRKHTIDATYDLTMRQPSVFPIG